MESVTRGGSGPPEGLACLQQMNGLDASLLATFSEDYKRLRSENETLRAELAEARVFTRMDRDAVGIPVTVPDEAFLNLPSGAYRYPTASETVERAVWRRIEFRNYLKRNGIDPSDVRTSLVVDWFKKWLLDERNGWQRRKDAGFALDDVDTLTVHHVVAQEVGGRHSIFNYHILPRAINSHLGWQIGKSAYLWVGEENVRVALQYAKFARDRTHVDDRHFNPDYTPCPRRTRRTSAKRPAEGPSTVVVRDERPSKEARVVEVPDGTDAPRDDDEPPSTPWCTEPVAGEEDGSQQLKPDIHCNGYPCPRGCGKVIWVPVTPIGTKDDQRGGTRPSTHAEAKSSNLSSHKRFCPIFLAGTETFSSSAD